MKVPTFSSTLVLVVETCHNNDTADTGSAPSAVQGARWCMLGGAGLKLSYMFHTWTENGIGKLVAVIIGWQHQLMHTSKLGLLR